MGGQPISPAVVGPAPLVRPRANSSAFPPFHYVSRPVGVGVLDTVQSADAICGSPTRVLAGTFVRDYDLHKSVHTSSSVRFSISTILGGSGKCETLARLALTPSPPTKNR